MRAAHQVCIAHQTTFSREKPRIKQAVRIKAQRASLDEQSLGEVRFFPALEPGNEPGAHQVCSAHQNPSTSPCQASGRRLVRTRKLLMPVPRLVGLGKIGPQMRAAGFFSGQC